MHTTEASSFQTASSGLQLFLLGTPSIRLHGEMLTPHLSRRAQALFYYLAVEKKSHSRDHLASLFWPDLPNQQARKNLRNIVPELRKFLSDYLFAERELLLFRPSTLYWCDLVHLQQKIKESTGQDSPVDQALVILHAIQHYYGEFLAGFSVANASFFEEWLTIQRHQLQQSVVDRLDGLAQQALAQGEPELCVEVTHQILRIQPWHETAHRLQLESLAQNGQRSLALSQYEHFKQILRQELDVEPDPETEQLVMRIRSGTLARLPTNQPRQRQEPAHRSLDTLQPSLPDPPPTTQQIEAISSPHSLQPQAVPHNLPTHLTPFIGRHRQVVEILNALNDPDQRLITLVGLGGIGKTRLALAAVTKWMAIPAEQRLNVADGIWFVSLANQEVSENPTEGLAATLIHILHLPRIGNAPLTEQLLAHLQEKQMLLILDSFEYLLPSIDFLLTLLHQSTGLKVLVTSRQRLTLQAESIIQVEGLSYPSFPTFDVQQGEMLENVLDYESTQLFIRRAHQANRSFTLNDQNRNDILHICHLLEGFPLAIELAASLVRRDSCAKICRQLQADLLHLSSSYRDLPPRHQSLKALLDSSWQLLSTDEYKAAAACSVFVGSWSAQAAQAVSEAQISTLHRLVDHSLLKQVREQVREQVGEQVGEDETEVRFEMHELVRQYAAMQMRQWPLCQQQVLARHAAYYMNLLASQEEGLRSTRAAQQHIQKEIENIRAAWLWSAAQKEQRLLALAVEGLQWFYRVTGLYRQAIDLLETALKTVELEESDPEESDLEESKQEEHEPQERTPQAILQTKQLRARLLCHTAQFYWRCSQVEPSEHAAKEALRLGQAMADDAIQALAYHYLARLAQVRNDFTSMSRLAERVCEHARQADDSFLLAEGLNDLGVALAIQTEPMAVISIFQQALHLLQNNVNHPIEMGIIGNLSHCYLVSHEYQLAHHSIQQRHQLLLLTAAQESSLQFYLQLGDLWVALGAYPQAQQAYEQALALFPTLPIPYWHSWLHTSLARLQQQSGRLDAALASVTLAQAIAQKGKLTVQEQRALVQLGHILSDLGDLTAARQSYEEAIALPKYASWVYCTVDAQAGLAALLLAQNEWAAALRLAEAALAQLTERGLVIAHEPFYVYSTCIRVLQANGDARATEVLQLACQKLFEQANQLEDASLRHSFLETVVANRELLAMAKLAPP